MAKVQAEKNGLTARSAEDLDRVRQALDTGQDTEKALEVPEGKDAQEWLGYLLAEAVHQGDRALISALLERVDDPGRNCGGLTPMHIAAGRHDEQTLSAMLRKGADPNGEMTRAGSGGPTPLQVVCAGARAGKDSGQACACIRVLAAAGADISAESQYGDTALGCAVRCGDEEMVRLLLELGADIKQRPKRGVDALQTAVKFGRTEMVKLVLALGGNANSRARYGPEDRGTALHRAVMVGDPEVVRALLDGGADVHATDSWGCTALHLAAGVWGQRSGYKQMGKVMRVLLAAGGNVNRLDFKGWTPFLAAVRNNDLEMAELMADKAIINGAGVKGRSALHVAFAMKDPAAGAAMQTWLMERDGIDVNARDGLGQTPLHYVMQQSSRRGEGGFEEMREAAERLIAQGADLEARDDRGITPLLMAARMGNEEGYDFMVSQGASADVVDDLGRDALWLSVRADAVDLYKRLLADGQDIGAYPDKGFGLMLEASESAYMNWQEFINILLDHGADVNAVSPQGDTLLHEVIGRNDIKMAGMLVEKGADVNARNKAGETPLLAAVKGGAYGIVKRLLDRGATLDAKDKARDTALHIAAQHNSSKGLRCLKSLLKNGAAGGRKTGVDSAGRDGYTPLHRAVLSGNLKGALALIAHGADLNRPLRTPDKDSQPRPPLHVALELLDFRMAEALLTAGADTSTVEADPGLKNMAALLKTANDETGSGPAPADEASRQRQAA